MRWEDYTEIHKKSETYGGRPPRLRDYCFLKLIEHGYSVSVLLLTLIFTAVAFLVKADDPAKVNWALHAAELSLGVFLGLKIAKKGPDH